MTTNNARLYINVKVGPSQMKNMQVLKKELIEKAMHCKNAEELMALAESEGISLTKEEAEAYLAEMEDVN